MQYSLDKFKQEIELRRDEWEQDALCSPRNAGPGGYDYMTTDKADQRKIAARCQGCSVRYQCLEYALVIGEDIGVWGATESDRKKLRRTLRAALLNSSRQTFHTLRAESKAHLQPFLEEPVTGAKRKRRAPVPA